MPGSGSGSAGSWGRSGEVNGNAAASAAVSIVRVSFRASVPAGRVVTQPCRERKVAGAVTSSSELATARTAATSSARSSSLAAWTVRYRPRRNSLPSPRASRYARSRASPAAASVSGPSSWPRSAPARRPDSSRARWRRSRLGAAAAGARARGGRAARGGAGGAGRAGQWGGRGGARRGRQPAAPAAGRAGAGAAGLAGDEQDLADEQVPAVGEPGEERGVIEGGCLQG